MLDLNVAMNRDSIPKDSKKEVYLKLDISLKEMPQLRPPIDLYLILDISKSMEKHDKIKYAKRAIMSIFDMLGQYDRLNIVAFSRYANILGENMNQDDKDPFYEAVLRDLRPTGNTVLSRALKLTKEVMMEKKKKDNISRLKKVILISDGKPTEKNNKLENFVAYVYKAYSPESSFIGIGVGPDYNEELLRSMAEVTGGSWMHISTGEKMAQNISIEVEKIMSSIYPIKMSFFPSAAVEIEGAYTHKPYVFNLDYFRTRGKMEWGYNFILPSLGKDDVATTLMKLSLNSPMEGTMRVGAISLFDFQNKEYKREVTIEVKHEDMGERNPKVRELFSIVEMMYSVSKSLDNARNLTYIEAEAKKILANPEASEEWGEELHKIMEAIERAKNGGMNPEDMKKTKILLMNEKTKVDKE